jgi:hypothetical protein
LLSTDYKIQATQEKSQFAENWGGPIVFYLNKYTIKSVNSKDSTKARYLYFDQIVDWPGETHNGWGF